MNKSVRPRLIIRGLVLLVLGLIVFGVTIVQVLRYAFFSYTFVPVGGLAFLLVGAILIASGLAVLIVGLNLETRTASELGNQRTSVAAAGTPTRMPGEPVHTSNSTCPSCGNPTRVEHKFCRKCGHSLTS